MAIDGVSNANPVDVKTDGAESSAVKGPSSSDGGEDGSRAPRLPRWTRQEILVLIQGKRVAESKVRRIRTGGGAELGSGQVEPKWASVSSYCRMHGVNRGPVQCRKRWSNLAGDYKKIKEWERHQKSDSFWSMRNDLRRERKLPGFFDKEVYDILDGVHSPPPPPPPPPEPVFDSRRGASAEDGMFSDFEQDDSKEEEEEAAAAAEAPAGVPVSSESGKKRKREEGGRDLVAEVLERNANALAAHLEAQNTHFQLDREQRKSHSDSLVAVLNKLADALVRISDKL